MSKYSQKKLPTYFGSNTLHISKEVPEISSFISNLNLDTGVDSVNHNSGQDSTREDANRLHHLLDCSHKRLKLSKKTLKNIKSIERLYKQPQDDYNVELNTTIDIEVPLAQPPKFAPSEGYEHIKRLVQNIYKSASDGIYNDSLWSKYSKKICITASLLHPSDVCLVLYSFSKIRYKDKTFLKILYPLLIKYVSYNSCRGLSLIMNSLKRLEAPNYDLIDLVVNEFCLNLDKANVQDIALVANSLSFFQVYHIKFWRSLYNSIMIRHHQIDPLQASLILASVAKLDIRDPLMLKLLKRKLRPAIEKNELPAHLLSLVYHSLSKLDFEAKYFYGACAKSFDYMVSNEKVDSQALVLFLYTSVCILEPQLNVVEKSLQLLSSQSDHLKSYKMIKLKYVLDHLNHKHQNFVDGLTEELKIFLKSIKDYRVKKLNKRLSRWAREVSTILKEAGVEHKRSVLFDYLYADIYIKEHNFIIKCTGPYSYYTKSSFLTKFAKIEQDTLIMKGFNVGIIPYYEWNRLKTNQDKVEYLKHFGENAALTLNDKLD
ncbi:hypothetical protein MACK_000948 [Theileria orientalis]|uniref:RAP domain-containing protein n=1 Tax=Theileria orientalis TaxID=68886 RepID=A0A976MCY9_THEOR|nr:hypothetical protein MACK_000948 [Theileria orientalis]